MRESRTRARLIRMAAGVVVTGVTTLGVAGPSSAAPDGATLRVPSSIDLGEAAPGTSVAGTASTARSTSSGMSSMVACAGTPATCRTAGLTFVFGGYRPGVDLRSYGDCTYYREKESAGRPEGLAGAVCHVTGALRPDTNYEIVGPDGAPIRLDVAPDAQGPRLQISGFEVNPRTVVSTGQSRLESDAARGFSTVTRGVGAPLRLVERGPGEAGPDWRPTVTSFRLRTAANPYDFEALGATATAEAGDTVTAAVGVRNHGPSTVAVGEHEAPFRLRVTVPPGARAVEAPRRCRPATPDWHWDTDAAAAGHPRFLCEFVALRAGAEVTFPFTMDITEVTGDTGSLELDLNDRPDAESANNTAKIALDPAPGTPSPTPTADGRPGGGASDGGASGGGASGGTGAGLPITGGDATTLALVAFAFLVLGTGCVLASRRRP